MINIIIPIKTASNTITAPITPANIGHKGT